jgi:competence protein ComEA
MDLTKREKTGLIIFIIITLLIVSIMYFNKSRGDTTLVIDKNKNLLTNGEVTSDSSKSKSDIKVYISGEIKKPGVYTLNDGDRAEKLIELCGGFTINEETSSLNLAMKLKDEDFIRIPSKLVNNQISNTSTTNTTNALQGASALININTATKEQLMDLPRIGDAMSQRIIDYREKMGAFKDIKDITNVSGIGPKMFENIKDKITVH